MKDLTADRQFMVDSQLKARGVSDSRVLNAMLRVPRELFVPEPYRAQAYEDHPLPIGEGQTISQPYIVARMLESLDLAPDDKVLEVGTGSGYVAALLGECVAQVFSIERHRNLAANAREIMAKLGYVNVHVFAGDGTLGLAEEAPFDAILVSAAALDIPAMLMTQLRDPGRMIIPIGTPDSQQMQFIRKINGEVQTTLLELVRFVPLISDQN